MTCPYCDSIETSELPAVLPPAFRSVAEGTHGCWECGKIWIRLGPHPPLHQTYEEVLVAAKRRSSKEGLRDLCKTCGHREDEHDHISGRTMRRDCEMPGCSCNNMIYWHDSESARLEPDVDPKKKLEDAGTT